MPRPVVHPNLLARIQGHFLTDTIDIQSPQRVSDGQGGWTRTYAVSSTVQGRVWTLTSGAEMFSADKTTMIASHRAMMPLGTAVTEEDRLITGGKTYRAVWVAHREAQIEVTLLEIE